MDSIDEEAVRIICDLSDISRGEHRLKIMADIPAGVELVSIEPNEAVVKVRTGPPLQVVLNLIMKNNISSEEFANSRFDFNFGPQKNIVYFVIFNGFK